MGGLDVPGVAERTTESEKDMTSYWVLYLASALPALLGGFGAGRRYLSPWLLLGVLFVLVIGLRFQVGADWYNYLYQYEMAAVSRLADALNTSDPGYAFLNWLMFQLGVGIEGVNLVCGGLFITGLVIFCRQMPSPWLALAVAVPYLVVVVAMGYTRQSVALGFVFWAMASLERGEFKRYLALIAVAVLFHKSAVLMIPLGLFLHGKGKVVRALAIVLAGYTLWDTFLAEHQETLWQNYVEAQMVSQGAAIRAWMNFVPAVLLLLYRKQWRATFPNYLFWFWLAIVSLTSVMMVGFASTAIDRVALYFSPIQVAVLSRLPYLARRQLAPRLTTAIILLGYAIVLFVWLNFASHAQYWLPYRNLLFL